MPEVVLKYTVPASTNGRKPAVSVDVTLTYTTQNQNGSYNVESATGTYTTTASDGTVTTDSISLEHRQSRGNNDNRIYLDGNSTFVDQRGLTFNVDEATSKRPHLSTNVNFFYSHPNKRYQQFGTVSGTATVSQAATATTTASSEVLMSAAVQAVCFASGTRIRTLRGDVAVEALAVGDLVITASGAPRSIRWLGHRTIDCRRHPRPAEVLPVRIAAHAFAPSKPARDLVVSPGHSLCVDALGEMLMPASALINGTTIAQIEVERVTYWHVELDAHEIVLAENLPAESYLEMGNRAFFAEAGTVALGAIPDAPVRTHADFCRPYLASGPLVEAVRGRLAARADDLATTQTETRAA